MEKKRLLNLLKSEPNKVDAIGMILSNFVDLANANGGAVSVKNFDKVAETLIEWIKQCEVKKEPKSCDNCYYSNRENGYHPCYKCVKSDEWVERD